MTKRLDPMQAMMKRRQAAEGEGTQPAAEYDRLMQEFKALQDMFEEQKQMLASMEDHTLADPVTGLANGRTLEGELNRSLATARRYGRTHALVLIEVMDFTTLCNRLQAAHPVAMGQKPVTHIVANHVAQLVRQNIRPTDIAARIEGGTFAVIFNELRMANNATDRAHEIAELLEKAPCITPTSSLHLSVRVGCRVFSGEDSLSDILNSAMEDMTANTPVAF